jgi:tetratricopeptide (TPR) repeat protein
LSRLIASGLFLLLCVDPLVQGLGADQQVSQLRAQLEPAEKAADKPAIIELTRRILTLTPHDSDAWETLAQTQLDIEDLDRLEQTLDAWQKAVPGKPSGPAAIESFRGALRFKRKDYQNAERHWLAYLATKPLPADAATEYDNLANLYAEQQRWEDHAAYRTKAIGAEDSAARRVARACAFLRLRKWDAAYADMAKANKMDASDSEVKEWLPQFEQLQKFLPQIKALDAQIAKSPNNLGLLLDRARFFTLAGRPLLALDDARRALKLQPASMRARIQTAEALLDTGRPEDAAKLQVSDKLARADDKHVNERALRELNRLDTRLLANPEDPDALAARSKILTELRQFMLALADANAALAITDKSPAAQFSAAQALDGLGRQKEALVHARIATELDPKDPAKWFLRGVLERQRADFAAAIESQTRSLEINESVVALSEREQCERRMGKVAQADADLRRIRELAPEHE